MHITVLSGGIGGARFIEGLKSAIEPEDRITVIANTGDDIWLFGLRVCPDLDTVMYTLGDGIDPERRWGRTDETWNAKEELAAYGVEPTWFGLGDRDLATHVVRTAQLKDGKPLSEVTAFLCERWQPGVQLLPMSDDEVETHIAIDGDEGLDVIHFQEYWIRLRASVPVRDVIVKGIDTAVAAPGVVDAILHADVVILPPSNPVVSVGTILSVAGVREALSATEAPVIGVSPIIGGSAVRGMADQLLEGLGIEISAAAIGLHYGPQSSGGVLDGWLIDTADSAEAAATTEAGIATRAVPLYMNDAETTRQLASDVLMLARDVSAKQAAS